MAVLACLVALAGIGGSIVVYRQIGAAQRVSQSELGEISDTFAQIATTLATVSASAAHASTSIGEARVALDDAATTTRSAADTLDQTAKVINFTVPGTTYMPLAGVDTGFRDQARQLRTVAGDVETTNAALAQNGTDLQAISTDVAAVSRQMTDISGQLRRLSNDAGGSLSTVSDGIRLLILWSVAIHVLLLGLGVCLYLLTLAEPTVIVTTIVSEERIAVVEKDLDW